MFKRFARIAWPLGIMFGTGLIEAIPGSVVVVPLLAALGKGLRKHEYETRKSKWWHKIGKIF